MTGINTQDNDNKIHLCSACNGHKILRCSKCDVKIKVNQLSWFEIGASNCSKCKGTGTITCTTCGGLGNIII